MQLGKVVSTDGTQIAAWRSGVGSPLVMIQGAGSSHTTFRFVAPLLARHFTVYAGLAPPRIKRVGISSSLMPVLAPNKSSARPDSPGDCVQVRR